MAWVEAEDECAALWEAVAAAQSAASALRAEVEEALSRGRCAGSSAGARSRLSSLSLPLPTAATHALYLSALAARRLTDDVLHHLRLLARPGSPVPPSPMAYRVVVECLVNHGRLADAVEFKDEMLDSGFIGPDPKVYRILMAGFVSAGDGAKAVELYQELKDKVGGEPVLDGIVYGTLMKAYFLMGMEEKAIECSMVCYVVRFWAKRVNQQHLLFFS